MSDLLNRARENADENEGGEFGYFVTIEPGGSWEGRWRGETTSSGQFGTQRVFLLYDRDGMPCAINGKSRLARKVDAMLPAPGDNVAIWRGDDEYSNGRTIHKYGLAIEPNSEPLPEEPTAATQTSFGDEAPW